MCGSWSERELDGSYRRDIRYQDPVPGTAEPPDSDAQQPDITAETVWYDGKVTSSWTRASLAAQLHAECLRALQEGGCCDPEQNPPKGAELCVDGNPAP
jgi:hypothetical protein